MSVGMLTANTAKAYSFAQYEHRWSLIPGRVRCCREMYATEHVYPVDLHALLLISSYKHMMVQCKRYTTGSNLR